MIRLLFFIALLFGLGFIIQQGAYDSGEAVIRWYGYEVRMQASFLAAVFLVFCAVFFFSGQFLAFLLQAPHSFKQWRHKRHYDDGFNYFLQGLEALRAGENKQAQKLAYKAQKLLPHKGLTDILMADSITIEGSTVKAIEHYKSLAQSDKGQFIGLTGLMNQAAKKRDWGNLRNYAKQARKLKPKNGYVIEYLFKAHLHLKNFDEALNLITIVQKYSTYTSEKLDEYEAFIYIEKSKLLKGKHKLKCLEKALKIQKNCLPAFYEIVKLYQSNSEIKKLFKLISAFFSHTAHLSIYNLWVDLIQEEDNKYYKRRLKSLLKTHNNTFIGNFIQGKEFMRFHQYEEALTSFKKAKNITNCQQVNILIAITANNLTGYTEDIKKALTNTEFSIKYHFNGEEILQAYKVWQTTYIQIVPTEAKNKNLFNILTNKRDIDG